MMKAILPAVFFATVGMSVGTITALVLASIALWASQQAEVQPLVDM